MLLIESILVLAALVVALTFPSVGSRWFEKIERRFSQLARQRMLSVVAVGLLALALRAALLPVLPIPEPIVHDEFAYLLAADTYAHGRLTNPTHPMWVHFESFGIIQQPSYQCIAQPAQGMILAAGKILFHHAFWGVWLAAGVMCAAICWMLQGWLPPRWALLGALLAVLRFGTLTYWTNSYWGGTAGAIGGALVLGALPRIKSSQRIRDALLMGLGLAILANSRPYEGFVFSLPVAVLLFAWMLGKHGPALKTSFPRVIVPLCLVLAATMAGIGYYCWRVTGSPFRMPYQVEKQTYGAAPYFLWQPMAPLPLHHHAVMRDMYIKLPQVYRFARSPLGLLAKAYRVWSFYLWPALTFPLFMLLVALPYGFSWRHIRRRTRFLLLIFVTVLAGLALETFYEAHYASPLTGVILAFVLLALRQLSLWRFRGKRSGLFLVRAIPVICVAMFVLRAGAGPLHIPLTESYVPAWYQSGPKSFGRAAILRRLQQLPGRQLVIVRYQPGRNPFEEWVYNEADIDRAKVVWARDVNPVENEELIKYFKGRRLWLLEPDETPSRLSQYPAEGLMAGKPEEKTRVPADSK
jgi:hypothetical protein